MPVTLFAQNLLETAAVSAPSGEVTRLYDRDASVPFVLSGSSGADIDIDLGSDLPVSAWAFVNASVGAAVTLYRGASFPPGTLVDSVASVSGSFLRTFAPVSSRYWQIHLAGVASRQVGEILLGVPRVISLNPILQSAGKHVVGNVIRDLTPGGIFHTVRRGEPRTRLPWAWNWLDAEDYSELTGAFAETYQGLKALLVQDELDDLRWMQITSASLDPTPISGPDADKEATEVALTFEESL
jgi:hypothetical protein